MPVETGKMPGEPARAGLLLAIH